MPKEDLKFIEKQIISEDEELNIPKQPLKQSLTQNSTFNGRPIFKNNFEKYEWLVKNEPENIWIEDFKQSKEYELFYGGER
jgi:hypothetical protein